MSKNYAIVQLSPELECARSALDLVLSLASLDQSVQLIMLDNAWMSLLLADIIFFDLEYFVFFKLIKLATTCAIIITL